MKCKHKQHILKCDPCLSKISHHLLNQNKQYNSCYVNAFINHPNSTSTTIRTFTQEEVFSNSSNGECITIPLTSSCSGSLLQVGDCKSPENAWCKIIDQANEYITSIQVPDCCDGCYTFDLSASVALTATMTVNLPTDSGILLTTTSFINAPVKATIRLSEQLPRDICVADEVSETPEKCFTSVTFPIIDTASATSTLSETNIGLLLGIITSVLLAQIADSFSLLTTFSTEVPNFTNLSVSGTVCLTPCQRLVPTLTIQPINVSDLISALLQSANLALISLNFTDIKLQLANLSLKLVRVCDCKKTCTCS